MVIIVIVLELIVSIIIIIINIVIVNYNIITIILAANLFPSYFGRFKQRDTMLHCR